MDGNETVSALKDPGIRDSFAVALVRHGGRCAYRGRDLVGERLSYASAQTDRLLPKAHFPDLANHKDNWVLSCSVCNGAKRDWFPELPEMRGLRHMRTPKAAALLENEADRDDLIGRAKNHVRRQTNHGRWEREWKAVRKIVRGS